MPSLASRTRTSREPWARWREVPYFARPSAANRRNLAGGPADYALTIAVKPVEEGTPFIPAHGSRRITFVPKPSGYRFYQHARPRGGQTWALDSTQAWSVRAGRRVAGRCMRNHMEISSRGSFNT